MDSMKLDRVQKKKLYKGRLAFISLILCFLMIFTISAPAAVLAVVDTSAPVWSNVKLTADSIGHTSLTLTWTAAADDVGVTGYRVYNLNDNSVAATVAGTDNSCVIGNLSAGATYAFKVEAGDAAGNWSTNGPSVTNVKTLPPPDATAPTWTNASLTISNVTSSSVDLSWTSATDNVGVTGYRVYQNNYPVATLDGTSLSYTAGNLSAALGYAFRIEACDSANNWSTGGPTASVLTASNSSTGGGSTNEGGMSITLTDPDSIITSDSSTEQNSELGFAVESNNLHFTWDFSNGLDNGLGDNLKTDLQLISLTDLTNNQQIALDTGTDADYTTGLDVLYLGDFVYTKTNLPEKLRRLELILKSTSLIPGHSYSITFNKNFTANNGATLGRNYTWYFSANLLDVDAPVWPADSSLTSANIGPDSITVKWPEAQDNFLVANYKIYCNDQLIATVDRNTLEYNVTGLEKGTNYSFKVEAGDVSGNWSNAITLSQTTLWEDTEVPAWPYGSTATTANAQISYVELSWTPATDNVGVYSYEIYKYDVAAQTEQLVATVDKNTLSYHVTGLTPATTYKFRIKAGDTAGNWSAALESPDTATIDGVADTTAPYWLPADGWLQTSLDTIKHSVTITWGPATDDTGVTSYMLYENGKLIKTVASDSRTFTETVIPDNTFHSFKIEAIDAAGNVSNQFGTSFFTGSTNEDVMRPVWQEGTVLNVSEITDSSVKLSWSKAPTDNTGVGFYELWWGVGTGTGTDKQYMMLYDSENAFDSQGNPVLSYTATAHPQNMVMPALLPDTTYTFWIKADDGACNSSAPLAITIKTAPAGATTVPTNTMAEYNFNLSATKSYASEFVSQDSNKIIHNQITSSVDPDNVAFKFDFLGATQLQKNPTVANGLKNITLQKSTGEPVTIFTTTSIALTNQKLLELPTLKLEPNTQYVLKFNPGTYAILQQSKSFTLTHTYEWSFTTAAGDKQPPVWPDKTLNTVIAPTSVNLTWMAATDDIGGVTKYDIYQGKNLLATVDSRTHSFNITGLTPNTPYTFSVQAGDLLNNWSTDGPTIDLTTPDTDLESPVWPKASSLTASNIADNGMTLTWTPAADNYAVKGYKVFKNGTEIASVNETTLSTVVSGLDSNTSYDFKVEAVDEGGNWSADGPSLTQATALDTILPTWPAGSSLTLSAADIVKTDRLTLYWNAAQDDIGVAAYLIYQDGVKIATITDTSTGLCDVTGLTANNKYTFKVEAQDAAGNISTDGPSLEQWTAEENPAIGNVKKLVAGEDFTLALKNDGTVWSWGKNNEGQLGDSTTTDKYSPVPVIGLNNIKTVDAGWRHGVALDNDGNVWAWGYNEYGQVGNGQSKFNPVTHECYKTLIPEKVQGMDNVVAIAAGIEFTTALKKDGTIWFWGSIISSQSDIVATPVQLPALDEVTELYAGCDCVIALRSDKTAWYFGSGKQWKQIPGAGFIKVASYTAGNNNFLDLIKYDGTVYTMTANSASFTAPVKVAGLTNIVSAAVGGYWHGAVKDDGTVWTWPNGGASNDFGVLGYNANPLVPTQVSSLSGVTDIVVGGLPNMHILKNDGTIYSWGFNIDGELGDGTTNLNGNYDPVKALFDPAATIDLTYAIVNNDGTQITALFNKPISVVGSGSAGFAVTAAGTDDAVTASVVDSSNPYKVILTLQTPVIRGTEVSISYSPGEVKATSGEVLAAFGGHLASNNAAAGIYSSTPAADTISISVDSSISILFSKLLKPETVSSDTVTLTKEGAIVPVTVSYDATTGTVNLKPLKNLDYGSSYTVTVSKQIVDIENLNPESDMSFSFTTENLINAFTPNSATKMPSGIAVDSNLCISFSKPIDPNSVKPGEITLEKLDGSDSSSSGDRIAVKAVLSTDGKYLTITHSAALDYGAIYRLTLPKTLSDIYGSVLGDSNTIDFYTQTSQLSDKPEFSLNGEASSALSANQNYDFTTKIRNLSSVQQNLKIRIVVRGGKGARSDHGGVILENLLKTITVDANGIGEIFFDDFSFTEEISGKIYVDVYVWDSNGLYTAAKPGHYEYTVASR